MEDLSSINDKKYLLFSGPAWALRTQKQGGDMFSVRLSGDVWSDTDCLLPSARVLQQRPGSTSSDRTSLIGGDTKTRRAIRKSFQTRDSSLFYQVISSFSLWPPLLEEETYVHQSVFIYRCWVTLLDFIHSLCQMTHWMSIAGDPPAAGFCMELNVVQDSPKRLGPQRVLFKSRWLVSMSSKKCNPKAASDQSSSSGTPVWTKILQASVYKKQLS